MFLRQLYLLGIVLLTATISAPGLVYAQSNTTQILTETTQEVNSSAQPVIERVTNQNSRPITQDYDDEPRIQLERQGRGPSESAERGQQTACERRYAIVEGIMNRQVNRGDKFVELFTTISQRVQNYYEASQLDIDGYDDALAKVRDNQTATIALITTLEERQQEFDCDNSPREMVLNFRQSHSDLLDSLKAYRDSVVELIVLVRTDNVDDSEETDV